MGLMTTYDHMETPNPLWGSPGAYPGAELWLRGPLFKLDDDV